MSSVNTSRGLPNNISMKPCNMPVRWYVIAVGHVCRNSITCYGQKPRKKSRLWPVCLCVKPSCVTYVTKNYMRIGKRRTRNNWGHGDQVWTYYNNHMPLSNSNKLVQTRGTPNASPFNYRTVNHCVRTVGCVFQLSML